MLAAIVNGTAAVLFIAVSEPDWVVVGLLAGASTVGGFIGARVGKRLPPALLRLVIIAIALLAIAKVATR